MTGVTETLPNARVTLRDVTTVKAQNENKCANCYDSVDEDSACKTFGDEIAILSLFQIKVVDALGDIFELHKKLYLSPVQLHEDLVLCFRCTNKLKKLYSFFVEFINSSNSPSFMNSIVKFSPTFRRIQDFRNVQSTDADVDIKLELVSFDGDSETEVEASSKGRSRIDHTSLVQVEYESDNLSDFDNPDDSNESSDPDFEQDPTPVHSSESDNDSNEDSDESKSSADEDDDDESYSPRRRTSKPKFPKDASLKMKRKSPTRKKKTPDAAARSSTPKKGPRKRPVKDVDPDAEPRKPAKRNRDGNSIRRYTCTICSEKFARTDHLRRHLRCHSEQNFFCPICSAGYKNQLRMEEHHKRHDPNYVPPPKAPKSPEKPKRVKGEKLNIRPECEICGKSFSNRYNMISHQESHKGDADKTFVCEICGSSFKTGSSLKKHQKAHDDSRNFLCKVCGLSFKRRHHLAEHETVKHGDLPRQFACPEPNCTKAFHRFRDLTQHRRLHSGTKYACEFGCGALFSVKYNRKVHQQKSCSRAPTLVGKIVERKSNGRRRKAQSTGQRHSSEIDDPALDRAGPNLLQSNPDSIDNPTAAPQQHFGRNNTPNFPFNFSTPMFPLGTAFPGHCDRGGSFNSNAILSRPVNDFQPNEFGFN